MIVTSEKSKSKLVQIAQGTHAYKMRGMNQKVVRKGIDHARKLINHGCVKASASNQEEAKNKKDSNISHISNVLNVIPK